MDPNEKTRVDSIDLLRGIVMVIMMLDHTRDFVHSAVVQFDPADLSRTNIDCSTIPGSRDSGSTMSSIRMWAAFSRRSVAVSPPSSFM